MEIEDDSKHQNMEDTVHSNQYNELIYFLFRIELDGVQIVDSAAEEQKVINKMEKQIKNSESIQYF